MFVNLGAEMLRNTAHCAKKGSDYHQDHKIILEIRKTATRALSDL